MKRTNTSETVKMRVGQTTIDEEENCAPIWTAGGVRSARVHRARKRQRCRAARATRVWVAVLPAHNNVRRMCQRRSKNELIAPPQRVTRFQQTILEQKLGEAHAILSASLCTC